MTSSFHVSPDNLDHFLAALVPRGVGFRGQDVLTQVIFHYLDRQPVDRASNGRNLAQHFGACHVGIQSALDAFQLPFYAAYTGDQFVFLAGRMCLKLSRRPTHPRSP